MSVREIPALATVAVGYRAYHLRGSGDGFVAASAGGR